MKLTNKHNLPPAIVAALSSDWYDKTDSISATTLMNPPRIYYLSTRHSEELSEDVIDRVWTLDGSAIHAVLENTPMAECLQEERLFATVLGRKISGKFDVFDGKTVIDFKTTSAWTIVFGSRMGEWTKQLNIYSYLLSLAGFNPKALQVIAKLRDWQKSKALANQEYPQIPIAVIDLPIWSFEDQEEYIKERIQLFIDTEKMADNDLPLCSDKERWMSETTYAVKRIGRKSAIKLFGSKALADNRAEEEKGYVEIRKGEAKRCKEYCIAKDFCNQYQEEI